MIYIFTALYCEAQPIINRLDMVPDGGYPFGGFVDDKKGIRLIITGVGKTNAAAAVAYCCARYGVDAGDFIINIGTCAGSRNREGAYLINKVTDDDTKRDYYPDMLYATGLRESAVTTVSDTATEETTAVADMLWEMEASGFCDSARLFLPPHKVVLIKVVSDNGADNKKAISDELLRDTIEGSIDDILRVLEVYMKIKPGVRPEMPDTSGLEEEFRCSQTMGSDLGKLMIYCRNSGRDHERILEDMRSSGILPAPDRRAGKEALNEFKRRILQ